jgi:CHAT domain-containing protein
MSAAGPRGRLARLGRLAASALLVVLSPAAQADARGLAELEARIRVTPVYVAMAEPWRFSVVPADRAGLRAQALQHMASATAPDERARALALAVEAEGALTADALAHLAQARRLAMESGSSQALAAVHLAHAVLRWTADDPVAGRAHAERALQLARRAGSAAQVARALSLLEPDRAPQPTGASPGLLQRWQALRSPASPPLGAPDEDLVWWLRWLDALRLQRAGADEPAQLALDGLAGERRAPALLRALCELALAAGSAPAAASSPWGPHLERALAHFAGLKSAAGRLDTALLEAALADRSGDAGRARRAIEAAAAAASQMQASQPTVAVALARARMRAPNERGAPGAVAVDLEPSLRLARSEPAGSAGTPLPQRVPADAIAELRQFARDNPLLLGADDPRSPDTRMAGLVRFQRWAEARGDPLLLIIAAGALASFTEQAGFADDALYYRSAHDQFAQRYRSDIPLELRLRRSVWLNHDLLRQRDLLGLAVRQQAQATMKGVQNQKDLDWKRLLELDDEEFIQLLGVDALLDSFSRQLGKADRDRAHNEAEREFGPLPHDAQAEPAELRRQTRRVFAELLPHLRRALAGVRDFGEALSRDDRVSARAAAEQTRHALGMFKLAQSGQWHYTDMLRQRVMTVNWTKGGTDCRAGAIGETIGPECEAQRMRIALKVEGHYTYPKPGQLPLEMMHRAALDDFEWTLMMAALEDDAPAVDRAVDELLAFYELYRDEIQPPEHLDVPARLRVAAALMVNAEDELEVAARTRAQDVQAELDAHMSAYVARLEDEMLAQIGGEQWQQLQDRAGNIRLSKEEPAAAPKTRYLQHDLLAGPQRLHVTRNEISRRDDADGPGMRIEHAFEMPLAFNPAGRFTALPHARYDVDQAGQTDELARWLAAPRSLAARANLSRLLESFVARGQAQALFGEDLAEGLAALNAHAAQHQSLMLAGQIALDAGGRKEDPAALALGGLPGTDFVSLREHMRAQPDVAQLLRRIAEAQTELLGTADGPPSGTIAALLATLEDAWDDLDALSGRERTATGDVFGWLAERLPLLAVAGHPALVFELLGQPDRAREHVKRLVVAVERSSDGSQSEREREDQRRQLAVAALLRGDCGEALRWLDAVDTTQGAADSTLRYQTAYLAARCLRRDGDHERALVRAALAVQHVDGVRRQLRARSLTVLLGPVRQTLYELWIGLLHDAGKGGELLQAIARYRAPSSLPVSLRADAGPVREALIEDVTLAYDVERHRGPGRPAAAEPSAGDGLSALWGLLAPAAGGRRERDQHQRHAEALHSLDALGNVISAELAPRPIAVDPALRASAKNEVVLAYFIGSRRGLVVAAAADGTQRSHAIEAGAAEIAARVARVRRSVLAQEPADADIAWLHRRLLAAPLADVRADRLRVAPDGPLWDLPFQMLRASAGEPHLIQTHVVSYVSGASQPLEAAQPAATRTMRLLVVADPDGSLPSARDEAERIAAALPPGSVTSLAGAAATRLALARELPSVTGVHLATHAAFAPEAPNFSALTLFDGEALQAIDLGGLDFAGKNVFLSACETRLGKLVAGEDPYGLADAFIASGAASVVATQWRVHSASTARFAARYYEERAAGASAAEALALAARAFLSRDEWLEQGGVVVPLDAPYHWAAFGSIEPHRP